MGHYRKIRSVAPHLILAILLGTGGLLRFAGIGRDLPYNYNPDEPVFLRPVFEYILRGDLNPRFTGHPGHPLIYLASLVLGIQYFLGPYPSLAAYYSAFESDPTVFWLLARGISAAAATASILVVYKIGCLVSGRRGGLAAAFIFSLLPINIRWAPVFRTDSLGVLLVLLSVACSLRYHERGGRWLGCAAILAGIATAVKYTSAAAIFPAAAAFLLRPGNRPKTAGRISAGMTGLAALFLLSFFLGAPYVILDFGSAYERLAVEGGVVFLEYPPLSLPAKLAWYLTGALPEAMGGILLPLLATAGAITGFRRKPDRTAILLFFPLVYLTGLLPTGVRAPRYLIYFVPFAAVLAGDAVIRIGNRLAKRPAGKTATTLLLILLSGIFPLVRSREILNTFLAEDIRTTAGLWIEKNIPAGEGIAYEFGTPPLEQFAPGRWKLHDTGFLRVVHHPMKVYREQGFRYLVISRRNRDLIIHRPDRWPEAEERYRELELFPRLAVFEKGQEMIEIYRLD